jgi:hypothetical protein
LLLTGVCRRTLDFAPLHAITAPVAGTGKSLLVDLTSILLTGPPAPVISAEIDDAEFEKRLKCRTFHTGIIMDTSRRKILALFGLGPAALVSGTAAASDPRTLQRNAKSFDLAAHKRLQNALAFVKSVNNDLRLYGLPPLDDGYVMRALAQASRTYLA